MSPVIGNDFEGFDLRLRQLLSRIMADCGKDRPQIARELSQRVDRNVTVDTLNDYTRTTKTASRFPAAYIKAFCEVTGDDSLQRFFLGRKLLKLIEIGELEISSQKNRAAKESALRDLSARADGEGR